MRRFRNGEVRVVLGHPMTMEPTQDEAGGSGAGKDCEPHADELSEREDEKEIVTQWPRSTAWTSQSRG